MLSFHESGAIIRLTAVLCALVCAGCGKPVSAPKDTETSPAAATDQPSTAPAPPAVDGAGQIRKDAAGRQYLGNVPLDVFFDDPLDVASDNTPVESSATEVPIPADPSKARTEEPDDGTPAVTGSALPLVDADSQESATGGWASLLPAETLDAEIKSTRGFLKQKLQSVGSYNASVTMIPSRAATIAVLAAIAQEHPERITWKADAGYVRDLAAQMITSPLQRGAQDQRRLLDLFESLSDTLNRSRPAGLENPIEKSFADVAEMRLVMMRIESAEKELRTEISESAFRSQADRVRHEAAMLASLMQAMTTEGYGYSEDPEFVAYAQGVIAGAQGLREAVDANDFAAFEVNLSRIGTSCQDCHRDYKNN